MAFPSGWTRYQKVTIDHTKLGGDETNLPVLLVWTGSAATSNVNDDIVDDTQPWSCMPAGEDIRCSADAAGLIQYPVEVVAVTTAVNTANARLEMHVNVTSVSSSTDTVFYLWYGNPIAVKDAVTDPYGRNAVWTNCLGVWHMSAAAGAAEVDSTGHGYTAANTGAVANGTGKWGGTARGFDGASQDFTITGLLGSPATCTQLAIIYPTNDDAANAEIFSMGDTVLMRSNTIVNLSATLWNGGRVGSYPGNSPTYSMLNLWSFTGWAVSPAVSHEIAYATYSGGAVAGADLGSATALSYTLGANTFIGHFGNGGTNWFHGYMEEIRVMSVYKTAANMTTYLNGGTSPQTFLSTDRANPVCNCFQVIFVNT